MSPGRSYPQESGSIFFPSTIAEIPYFAKGFHIKKIYKIIVFAFGAVIAISLVSCMERKTEDPMETYKFWAGELPGKNVEVSHGKYWQSAHWLKEYVMYMGLKRTTYGEYILSNRTNWSRPPGNRPFQQMRRIGSNLAKVFGP